MHGADFSSKLLLDFESATETSQIINYSCRQKPINDGHLGQVDKS